MKTAISIPDGIYDQAEQLAAQLATSRSQLYTQALADYVAKHTHDHITDSLNALYATESSAIDAQLQALQLATLELQAEQTRESW